MRIGIDARLYNESGIGRYLRNLLLELAKLDDKNEYYIFVLSKDKDLINLPKNFHLIDANIHWYTFDEQIKLPKLLKKYNLDLMHFPHFNVPVFYSGKFVVTIHDLIHQHNNMKRATTHNLFFYKIKRLAYSKAFETALKKSIKIITPSEFVKRQLVDEWKISENKIIVTHESVEKSFLDSRLLILDSKKVLNKFRIRSPYIFYVGNAHPHKNVDGLIKVFIQLRKKYQYLQLVLSGKNNYFWEKINEDVIPKLYSKLDPLRQLADRGDDIVYTDFITDEELIVLYKNAQIFVMPSKEEGFGIPLLEAMSLGCPVVSSNAASLPEVGGNAAEYFNPNDLEEMKGKIQGVLNNQKLRKELITKGQDRVKQFSWQKMAKQTLDIYLNS